MQGYEDGELCTKQISLLRIDFMYRIIHWSVTEVALAEIPVYANNYGKYSGYLILFSSHYNFRARCYLHFIDKGTFNPALE